MEIAFYLQLAVMFLNHAKPEVVRRIMPTLIHIREQLDMIIEANQLQAKLQEAKGTDPA